jgi:predicted anti-sigma-YlaC factor YlaD
MECTAARDLISRKIDGELLDPENLEIDVHLAQCASCNREYGLLALPKKIARAIPQPTPSPYLYQKLRARIESETQSSAIWQTFYSLARRIVPSLAGITLALISVFAYLQISGSKVDLYTAYASAFIDEAQLQRIVVAQQDEITDESILSSIAERHANRSRSLDRK